MKKLQEQNDKTSQNQNFQISLSTVVQKIDFNNNEDINFQTKDDQGKQEKKNLIIRNQQNEDYRPDIDGLRMIAVTLVIVFHACPQFLSGGFIGVDIFFVISGYLITKIIVKEQKFLFLNFYERRIRRIFPSLIVVLTFITFYICFYFRPNELKRAAQTIFASTYFSANIQLLQEKGDYFGSTRKTNPALHLWSLGVQEQFYIIWPLLIIMIKKITSNKIWIGCTLIACISFVFNSQKAYKQDRDFDFYFPLCRFWQMAIGGILSTINLKLENKLLKNITSLLGMIGILFCAFRLNELIIYPGFYALIPTICAALIILAGKDAWINYFILSHKQFVFGGKISYPLYLWHWPLLIFVKTFQTQKNDFYVMSAVFAAIFLSILTYTYVQKNLRYKKGKLIPILLIITMISIGAINRSISLYPQNYSIIQLRQQSLYNLQNIDQIMKPLPQDYITINGKTIPHIGASKKQRKPTLQQINFILKHYLPEFNINNVFNQISSNSIYYEANDTLVSMNAFQSLNQGKKNKLFIIGDSHAEFNTWRFKYLYEQSVKNNKTQEFPTIVLMTRRGVPPLSCHPFYDFFMNYIQKHKPTRILFSYRLLLYWLNYKQDNSINIRQSPCLYLRDQPQYQQYLKKTTSNIDLKRQIQQFGKTIKTITSLGIQVYVSTLNPQGPEFDPYFMKIDNFFIDDGHTINLKQFKQDNKAIIQPLQKQIIKSGGKIIDFSDYQCLDDIFYRLMPNGFPIFIDSDHPHRYLGKYWGHMFDFLTQF